MSSPTTILYKFDYGSTPSGLKPDAVAACVKQAADEWSRVLKGMVSIVPYTVIPAVLGSPVVLVKFGHTLAPDEPTKDRVLAITARARGTQDYRWKIELRDDAPPLDWSTPKYGGCRVLWRKLVGMPTGQCVTAVMLHEFGHMLQMPHEEPEVKGLIMSRSAPMVETISSMETKRYRQYFTDHVWSDQNE